MRTRTRVAWSVSSIVLCAATVLVVAGCRSRSSGGRASGELALAAAASENLTVALADSLAPLGGFMSAAETTESLSACDDHVDATGWESFSSSIVEMELPPGFASSGSTGQRVEWRASGAWIRATPGRAMSSHSGPDGAIVSECDVFISGSPTHIDLVNTMYGKGVYATIQVQGQSPIGIQAQAQTIGRQAQLLHAIRYARVSSAWGR